MKKSKVDKFTKDFLSKHKDLMSQLAKEEEIDDKINEWHNGDSPLPLHEYLGMTWEEYTEFVKK